MTQRNVLLIDSGHQTFAALVAADIPDLTYLTVSGSSGRASCRAATTAVLPGTPNYLNGTAGVGATLTEVGFGALTVDGVTVAVNDRVLVKTQADPKQNGIYVQTVLGTALINYVLVRATDYDQSTDIFEGTFTVIEEGTVNSGSAWEQTTAGTITPGTSSIVFAELKGEAVSTNTPAAVGTAAAGTSTTKANDDHVHATGAGTPSTQAFGDAAATGSGPAAAMTDHKHAMMAYQPITHITRTSNTILAAAQAANDIDCTSAFTQTLTAAATLGAGWWCLLKNATSDGTTVLVVDPNGSETIDGLTTITMYSGETRLLMCDGANFASTLMEGGYARFITTGSFIVPAGIERTVIEVIGAGGGGGGGMGGAASSVRQGGTGGGGGHRTQHTFSAVVLGSAGATITVTVPAGGAFGAGGSSATGVNGTPGSNTTFGTIMTGYGGGGGGLGFTGTTRCGGSGGGSGEQGGLGGTATIRGGGAVSVTSGGEGESGAAATVAVAGAAAQWGGGSGGGQVAAAGVGLNGGTSVYGGGAGASGGGLVTGNTPAAGGVGGNIAVYGPAGGGGTAGGSGAGVGQPGADGGLVNCGAGGGGGGTGVAVTGGVGGAGGALGGGGGGGGGGTTVGGAGGAGGRGECRIWYN
jgi:hypothetical protein